MIPDMSRRELVRAAPPAALLALLGGGAAAHAAPGVSPAELYRVDDEATILAAARAIVAEDWVGTLITVDENGVPRARSVGVSDPDPDMTMWISTRRGSRKLGQIARHPQATLHFARDAIAENFAGAYYASFMGEAFVHLDAETLAAHAPAEDVIREDWPNFPHDYAVIRFRPAWLEVYGRGIRGRPDTWQPQAVVLPA